jgi:hypothetical protein
MPYLGVRPADITSATEAEVAGDLTVDTNTLKVDAANNRVFVGATSGDRKFEVHDTGVVVANFKSTGANSLMAFDNSSDTSQNHMIGFSGDDFRVVETTEKIRVLSSGGITFNGDTAAANALDDAEYGTFTVTDASGAGLTLTQNVTARYAKIGRLVFVNFYVTYPTTSASGTATLGGFPFGGSTNSYSYLIGRTGNHAANDMVWQLNNTSAQLHYNNLGKNNSDLSGQYVLLSGCYYTDN